MKKPTNTVFLPNAKKISRLQFEFVALMASLMSVVALAIDALLLWILVTIGTTEVVDNQLLFFLGLGFGPLVLAPSDSFGRKPVVYMGFALFIIVLYV
jgi:DHA1 family bicyclomycin/chloramphenicol resistance-like MFS transporter